MRRSVSGWRAYLLMAAGPLCACSGPTEQDELVGTLSTALSVCNETVPANRIVDGIPAYDQCSASQNSAIYSNNGVDTSTSAQGNDWVRTQWSGGYQCTELAHRYLYFRWNVEWIPNGNAGTWCDDTPPSSSGVVQTSTPVHGDILVFPPGQCGADSYYGHVVLVDTVDSASRVTIVEQNRAGRRSTEISCARCFLHVVANDGSSEGAGGAAGTGGAPTATGGAPLATGGAPPATGGAAPATGGFPSATGGAFQATGGAVVGTGGVPPATGGAPVGAGGVVNGTAGSAPGTGGLAVSTGGAPPGAGGSVTGGGGAIRGLGGAAALQTGGAASGGAQSVDGAATQTGGTSASDDEPADPVDEEAEETVAHATDSSDTVENPAGCSCRAAGENMPARDASSPAALLAFAALAMRGRRRSARSSRV